MDKREVLSWIKRTKIVPVVRAASPEAAMKVVDAILEGGMKTS
jgi:2-dehydro-3-deoxyphosphogluconate aldolase / (4S)-4-hydroxy-2-oxoglutarate aldolase